MVFSKKKFMESEKTGNELVDKLLNDLKWVNDCDGKEVIETDIQDYPTGYILKDMVTIYTADNKLPIKKQWIKFNRGGKREGSGRKTMFSEKEIDRILKQRSNGIKAKLIAKQYGCNIDTIYKLEKRYTTLKNVV